MKRSDTRRLDSRRDASLLIFAASPPRFSSFRFFLLLTRTVYTPLIQPQTHYTNPVRTYYSLTTLYPAENTHRYTPCMSTLQSPRWNYSISRLHNSCRL